MVDFGEFPPPPKKELKMLTPSEAGQRREKLLSELLDNTVEAIIKEFNSNVITIKPDASGNYATEIFLTKLVCLPDIIDELNRVIADKMLQSGWELDYLEGKDYGLWNYRLTLKFKTKTQNQTIITGPYR